jgi:hypothetical protein
MRLIMRYLPFASRAALRRAAAGADVDARRGLPVVRGCPVSAAADRAPRPDRAADELSVPPVWAPAFLRRRAWLSLFLSRPSVFARSFSDISSLRLVVSCKR